MALQTPPQMDNHEFEPKKNKVSMEMESEQNINSNETGDEVKEDTFTLEELQKQLNIMNTRMQELNVEDLTREIRSFEGI